jgi:tryptophan halogenase
MHKIIIVGGGTAGAIAAAYIKSTWGPTVEINLIHDSKTPSIGVGESLTPSIFRFLNFCKINKDILIKEANATMKLGLKFKNWLNDGKSYYHPFDHFSVVTGDPMINQYADLNLAAAYDMMNGTYDLDRTYSGYYMDNCLLPDTKAKATGWAMHIDATKFSEVVLKLMGRNINIIDDKVNDVIVKDNNIDGLILEKKGLVKADFYIDASGFKAVLMNKLKNTWVDKSDWLPLDRFIPNPVPTFFDKLPPYTTSEATDNGWILQVPLQHRWGTGYLYCSEFTSDDEAHKKFATWTRKNHKVQLPNDHKILKFKSGYWEDLWVGNCLAIGLSSSFSEPLEATNIHQAIDQLSRFGLVNEFNNNEWDRKKYNKWSRQTLDNIYLYLRFCYTTDRTDSKFWKYMTNNVPSEVALLDEKARNSWLTFCDIDSREGIFSYVNFTAVSAGLNKPNKEKIMKQLIDKNKIAFAKSLSEKIANLKNAAKESYLVDHKQYLNEIINSVVFQNHDRR